MAAKVFESIGKFGLALAIAGGVVNSALYNDLQNVSITLHILFRPVASQLPCIFTGIREDYDEHVLLSITTEILKSMVARFDAGELITQRELVSRQVSDDLTERAATFGLILDDVSLTHLTFGKEFTAAVEAKQVAQQEAERARSWWEACQKMSPKALRKRAWACGLVAGLGRGKFMADERGRVSTLEKVVLK
nr:prohibitin-like [Camelus dromedarius]